MRTSVTIALLTILVLASPGPFLEAARSDMAPIPEPGTHPQTHITTLDLGAWADYTVRFAKVEKGDTFGGLARKHLGSFKRWKEIAELNRLDARALPIGMEILLPPRHEPLPPGGKPDPERPDAREWWDFFVFHGVGKLERHGAEAWTALWVTGSCLVAIRHDKVEEVLKRIHADLASVGMVLDKLAPASPRWLARSHALPGSRRVKDTDPAHKVETHWRVTGIEGGKVELEKVSEQRLGKDGQVLPVPAAPPPADAEPSSGDADPLVAGDQIVVLLAVLVAIGAGVLLVQRARRSAEVPVSAASGHEAPRP